MKPAVVVSGPVRYLRDPLRKNSFFLIATHGVIALFGFFFWRLAEDLYGTEDVGLAAALVSAVLLLHTIARLGLDIGLIRFLPNEADKPGMINTSFTMVVFISTVLALIFVLGTSVWAPSLNFVRENAGYTLLFIVFTIVVSLVEILRQGIFVAFRKTQASLAIELLAGLRLPLLLVFISMGSFGIFIAWGLAGVAAFLAGILLVMMIERTYRPALRMRGVAIENMMRFSLGNYVAESFRELPGFVLPIIVVGVFAAEMGAYFYIAWTVAGVIMMISYATGSSLLAEGSLESARFGKNAARAIRFMLLLLVPAILLVFLVGDRVLAWFGTGYSENAYSLLCLLSVSGIPLAINTIYVTYKRVQRDMKPVICLYVFVAVSTIGVGYALMERMELVGIGIAWLSSNCVAAVIVSVLMIKRWLRRRSGTDQPSAEGTT